MRRTRIKICCIASRAEAELAVAAGADALGFVGPMPTGPGIVSDEETRAIAAATPAPVSPWLLTAATEPAAIAAHAERCAVTTVQLVRHIDPSAHARLAEIAPWLRRVQVIHVEDEGAVARVRSYGDAPHALLLDSGRVALNELGGTGRVHDWAISRRCVAAAARPVFLAGGLSPDNVARAIETVRPFGLDLCSGIRPNRTLDPDLLGAFVSRVRDADAALARAA